VRPVVIDVVIVDVLVVHGGVVSIQEHAVFTTLPASAESAFRALDACEGFTAGARFTLAARLTVTVVVDCGKISKISLSHCAAARILTVTVDSAVTGAGVLCMSVS
jgi:hypothetical protein